MSAPLFLIVEDNAINLELARDLLELEGFQVLSARDAVEGCRLARQCQPDLILMDISLPGMDGLAATRQLKGDPATAGIPVVALTAHAMRGDEPAALLAGCDGYLSKPINTRAFAGTLRAWLKPQTKSPQPSLVNTL
jgi:CheY-like chemotaxis protein